MMALQVERMIKNAEKYAEQDKAAEEKINAIQALENYLDAAERPFQVGGSPRCATVARELLRVLYATKITILKVTKYFSKYF